MAAIGSLLAPGSVVGGEFVVVRPLDEGGMGRVYLVEQKSTGKQRALKVMHREIVADASLQLRFEQEARVGARIASEHVVEVLAAGIDAESSLPYLVMELLEGEDLRARVDTKGPLSHEEVQEVFEQLCHAMAAAHAAGVVHRDLKPENVFLARSRRAGAGRFTVKVLDFGIAKLSLEAGTRSTKAAVGSPMWMAPEQTVPGLVTPAADVWALGLLAYELLTGRAFWRAANEPGGTTAQLLREVVLDPIPAAGVRAAEHDLAGRLPAGFDGWFARCVAREPSARFADAGLAWRAMQRMLAMGDGLAETAVDPSGGGRPRPVSATGDATPFLPATPPAGPSGPPPAGSSGPPPAGAPGPVAALPQETPVATVHRTQPAASPRGGGRGALVAGVAIAVVGVASGWALSHRAQPVGPPAPLVAPPVVAASTAPSGSAVASAEPQPLPSASSSAPAPPAIQAARATAPVTATSPVASSEPPKSPPRASPGGGFLDPTKPDGTGPTQWKVQDHHVRLFSRLVSNESNVADAVVRKAVEWDAWEYLRCYERVFSGAKDLAEGTVTVGFDILDQLPRHAQLQGSTFPSRTFNDCVVGTLTGQTINAAGPDGRGHVVYAFRFVPMN